MLGCFIGAVCAAVPGLIDLLFYKGGVTPVRKIALTHKAGETVPRIADVRRIE